MGLLKNSSVYLIGSVDHHKDPGKWRKDITKDLLHPLGIKVYDPLIKPDWFNQEYPLDVGPSHDFVLFKEALYAGCGGWTKETKEQIEKRMWAVRDLCLRMAHDANFIIASLPKKFTVGTMEELGVAAAAKKPILIYLPDGPATSTWLPPQIGKSIQSFKDCTFSTMDELYNKIRKIDSGEAKVDNLEWMFLSYFNDKVVINESTNC